MRGPDLDRWRRLAAVLAAAAALAGGASTAPDGTPDGAADVALCGGSCQHNQVLL